MYLKEELALKSSQKFYKHTKTTQNKGLSSGRVVSVIAFFSDDPSSNPAKVSKTYCVKMALEEGKQTKKRPFKTFWNLFSFSYFITIVTY